MEWTLLSAANVGIALAFLQRLTRGQLFLLALPFDRMAWDAEISDAQQMASLWRWPAIAFLIVASFAVILSVSNGPLPTLSLLFERLANIARRHRLLCGCFITACLFDFVSTTLYCQRYGVIDEVHPGMRLIIYAFGLTMGVFFGKSIQAALLVVIGTSFPQMARPLLVITAFGYTLAAVWNLRFL